jgi:hypothetical protein
LLCAIAVKGTSYSLSGYFAIGEFAMANINEADIEQRIRERAFQIWLAEGQPDGRDREHWELAKFAIAQQDGLESSLVPAKAPQPEPIEAVLNQAEFPTLVDQGEGQIPGVINE